MAPFGAVDLIDVAIGDLRGGEYGVVRLCIAEDKPLVEAMNNISTTRGVLAVVHAINAALVELGGTPYVAPRR